MLRIATASCSRFAASRLPTSCCVGCPRPTRQRPHSCSNVLLYARHYAASSEDQPAAETTRTINIPPYMRLRDFSKRLGGKISVKKLLSAIGGKRSKRKIFLDDVQTNRSFVFRDTKQVVLPFQTMESIITQGWEDSVRVEVEKVEPTLRPLPQVTDKDEISRLGLVERRALVAVLGHIDHGKTTLVDALRGSNTVDSEEGGITQAIGAWPAELRLRSDDDTISRTIPTTFLDTPGHVHFYQMREDSARVATAALLVVACDEDVLEDQTLESINCLLDMDVPVVVAINKIDLETANPRKTRALLEENGVLNTTIGGIQPSVVEVSAKEKLNLEALEYTLAFAVTRQKLLAYGETVPAEGIVIEAINNRHRGALVRVVVSAGVLRLGQSYVSGGIVGVVKAMYDEVGKDTIEEAHPGQVVYVSGSRVGLTETPPLGEPFFVLKDRKEAAKLVEYRDMIEELKQCQVSGPPLGADPSIMDYDEEEEDQEGVGDRIESDWDDDQKLPLVLKAESAGKLDALLAALADMDTVVPIRASVGPPRKGDIEAASGIESPLVCFGVKVHSQIEKTAREHGVPLMKGMVLHELIESIEAQAGKKNK